MQLVYIIILKYNLWLTKTQAKKKLFFYHVDEIETEKNYFTFIKIHNYLLIISGRKTLTVLINLINSRKVKTTDKWKSKE